MSETRFDLRQLFQSIDAQREARGLSWAALSREVGVASSTIRRFGGADDAEADGVLALIRWLGATPEHFVAGSSVGEELLPPGDGIIRVDMDLVAAAMGDLHGAKGRTRTTIQTLVEAGLRSGRPVASLTRRSDA